MHVCWSWWRVGGDEPVCFALHRAPNSFKPSFIKLLESNLTDKVGSPLRQHVGSDNETHKLWDCSFHNAITSVSIAFAPALSMSLVYAGSIAGTVTIIGLERSLLFASNQHTKLIILVALLRAHF